jgi:hypothetical protein
VPRIYDTYRHVYSIRMETPKIAKDKTEKQKLTLGIDRGIIDRAKAAGINISAITEHLLRSITYDPKGDTTETVVKAYQALFDAMWPLLDKYDTTVEVGRDIDHNAVLKISLEPDLSKSVFLIHIPLAGEGRRPSLYPVHEELVSYLYEPNVILQNLILAVSEGAQKNREKVRELDFALRLVKALSDDRNNQEKDRNANIN